MRKFVKVILVYFILPAILLLPIVNIIIDPSHLFDQGKYEKEIISILSQGYNCTNVDANMNERFFKRYLIESHKGENFDYLVMGSSRIMTINEEDLHSSSILNVGVSGGCLEDLCSMYEICLENGIHISNVVIGLEPQWFNKNIGDVRWQTNSVFFKRYCKRFGIKYYSTYNPKKYINLFSLTYLQAGLRYIFNGEHNLVKTKKSYNPRTSYLHYGSLVYGNTANSVSQDEVDKDASENVYKQLQNYKCVDSSKLLLFEKLLMSFRHYGVNVIGFKVPYHPLLYDRIWTEDSFKYLRVSSSIFDNLLLKEDYLIIGGYDPRKFLLDNTFFYDGMHLRQECYKRILSPYFN